MNIESSSSSPPTESLHSRNYAWRGLEPIVNTKREDPGLVGAYVLKAEKKIKDRRIPTHELDCEHGARKFGLEVCPICGGEEE